MKNQRIVCAAMKNSKGQIVVGVRHRCPIMRGQIRTEDLCDWVGADVVQGFVDNRGNFLNRKEALAVARRQGQILYRCGGDEKQLYSENLY